MILLRLFLEFFKAGLFAVGGGLATIPFLSDMAERTGWFTREMLADMIAVGESTPGPIGINTATYVGYTVAGVPGGIIATAGLVAPSVIVILIVAAFLKAFRSNRYVDNAFYGVRPASTAMIAAAGLQVLRLSLVDTAVWEAGRNVVQAVRWQGAALFVILWVLTNIVKPLKKLHPAVFLLASAVIGVVFRFAGA